jgi:hypothetical protein
LLEALMFLDSFIFVSCFCFCSFVFSFFFFVFTLFGIVCIFFLCMFCIIEVNQSVFIVAIYLLMKLIFVVFKSKSWSDTATAGLSAG